MRTAPLRGARAPCPSGRSQSSSGTAAGCRPPTAAAARPSACARRARSAHLLRAPGQLGIGRAYVAGHARGGRPRRGAASCSTIGKPPPDRPRRAGALGARGGPRLRADAAAAAPPAAELRPRGRRHSAEARRARRAPPLRRRHRVLRAVPRRVDDLQLRDLLARRRRRSRRRSWRSSSWSARKLELSRASACSTSAAGGAASRSTPPRATACRWSGITLSEPQAALARRARRRGRARGPGRDPRDRLPRARAASRSTRSPASAWSSTWARRRSTSTRSSSRGCCGPGGRLLNHGIARAAAGRSRGGAVLRALRVPGRRAAAPLADPAGARARRVRDRPRRGLPRGLRARRCATGCDGLDEHLDEAVRLGGTERVRVWRLYLRAARNGFQTGFMSIYQVRCSLR